MAEYPGLAILAEIISEQPSAVLVVVAVDAKVFPVGAVRRVVFMIPVLVVNGVGGACPYNRTPVRILHR